jgi:hypothetical protein
MEVREVFDSQIPFVEFIWQSLIRSSRNLALSGWVVLLETSMAMGPVIRRLIGDLDGQAHNLRSSRKRQSLKKQIA